jgi:alkylhydroperoxidase family enzyme
MPRIDEVTVECATPEQQRVLDEDEALYGDVLNTTRIYAHAPELLAPLRALHAALAGGGLPELLVSLARLRVAQINGCPF